MTLNLNLDLSDEVLQRLAVAVADELQQRQQPMEAGKELPPMLTLPQVCGLVGVGETKLRQMIDEGDFPSARIKGGKGCKALWSLKAVEQWIDRAV